MTTPGGTGNALALMGQGFTFAASVGIMAYAGHKADEWLGSEPWLLITGTMIGVALAIYNLIRTVEAWEKRQKDREE